MNILERLKQGKQGNEPETVSDDSTHEPKRETPVEKPVEKPREVKVVTSIKKIPDVSQATAIVVDSGGSYVSMAKRLAKEFKKVYYCNPSWVDAYPLINKAYIGEGIEEITVVPSVWAVYKEIDVFIFPDVYYGDFAQWLFEQGKAVWGSKLGEELELQRDVLKTHLTSLGLPMNPWKSFTKFDDLRKYLKTHDDVYVKINRWRGLVETFHSPNYKLIEPELDEMQHNLSALKNDLLFVVEEPIIDAVEVGYDGWTINGKYPEICLSGVEIKDKAYAGIIKPYEELSPLITDFNEKMADTFEELGYCGNFSTELRVKGKVSTLIDFTARNPCPPGEIYLGMFENYGEIILGGANGEVVEPKAVAKYAVELLMESDWSVKNYQPVYFPEKYSDRIFLKKACVREGINYVIPQAYGSSDIGAVIGLGDTLEEAVKECLKVADSVEGNEIKMRKDTLDDAQEELDKFKKIGK